MVRPDLGGVGKIYPSPLVLGYLLDFRIGWRVRRIKTPLLNQSLVPFLRTMQCCANSRPTDTARNTNGTCP